ncbi:CU044_2847 family protein [Streptomyces polygonati]|uniref:CU044_2847 family protein n=1 Tax=Streptomyces polygonati TaxID=1617087 RepID=A0ABV8HG54_9ACTN
MPETHLVRMLLDAPDRDDAAFVLVEVDSSTSGIQRASRPGDVAATAVRSLGESFDQVRAAAEAALSRLTSLSVRPRTVELELGVKFSAEAGAVIARTAAEGNVVLRLTWENPVGQADSGP